MASNDWSYQGLVIVTGAAPQDIHGSWDIFLSTLLGTRAEIFYSYTKANINIMGGGIVLIPSANPNNGPFRCGPVSVPGMLGHGGLQWIRSLGSPGEYSDAWHSRGVSGSRSGPPLTSNRTNSSTLRANNCILGFLSLSAKLSRQKVFVMLL